MAQVRRGSLIQLVTMGVVFGVLAALVALLVPWLPDSAGKEADRIDFVFWFTTWICVGIFAIVAAVLAYAVLRFRVKPDDDTDGPPIHGHTGLEIVWTAVPAVLVTAISIVSAVVLAENSDAGSNPLKVKVIAQQFAWTFEYSNGVKSGRLVLPKAEKNSEHKHVELEITSKDVLHSFWVPQLGQKQDAVPGSINKLVITPTKLGTFPVICTELCGLGHALMRSQVQVMKQADFDNWLKQQQGGGAPSGGAAAGAGAKVFAAQGCGSCHTFAPAKSTAKVGPDLDKLPEEAKRANKPLEDFIKESIVDPNAYIEPGFSKGVMPPNFKDTIKPNDLDALVQYLARGGK